MVDTQNITRMGKKKKKDSGNMVRMMGSVHFGLKMVRRRGKSPIKMMRNMVSGHTGLKMAGLIKKRNIPMASKQMASTTIILITK